MCITMRFRRIEAAVEQRATASSAFVCLGAITAVSQLGGGLCASIPAGARDYELDSGGAAGASDRGWSHCGVLTAL